MKISDEQRTALTGKNVLIFGGSSGIGLATAKAAAAEGAQITIVSGNKQRIDAALLQLPQGSRGYQVDLGKEENIKNFFEKASRYDHLVYTAGENLRLSNIVETDIDQARLFFNVRYWGAFALAKYGAPHINSGGSINLTGGIGGMRPAAGWSIAASICSAMEGLTRAMAIELAPIRVNSVVPGIVKTNLWDSMPDGDRENLYKYAEDAYLVKRAGDAGDIAMTHIYLMKQPFITGQNLVIDGGAVLV